MKIPIVFIAGPFRGATPWEVEENIRRAERASLDVWFMGAAALCPHTNTRFFDGVLPDEVFLEGIIEMMTRCDIVYCFSDEWESSRGTFAEIAIAKQRGIPVAYSLHEVRDAIRLQSSEHSDSI